MSRLDELIRAVRAEPPEPIPTERMWAAIEAGLVQVPLAQPGSDGVGESSWLGSLAPAKVLAGVVLALGSGLLGGWLSSSPTETSRHFTPVPVVVAAKGLVEPEPRSQPSIPAITAERPAAPFGLVSPASPPPGPPDEKEEAPEIVARVDAPRQESASTPPTTRRYSKKRAQAEPAARPPAPWVPDQVPRRNDIRAELLLVEEMQVAFRRGDMATVLQKADQHGREFGATGQLIQERLVHTVEALCALGRVDEAKQAVRELLTNWPESTHTRRASSSCAGPG